MLIFFIKDLNLFELEKYQVLVMSNININMSNNNI